MDSFDMPPSTSARDIERTLIKMLKDKESKKGTDFKSFSDMPDTLRAQAAAGMTSRLELKPSDALELANILEDYGSNLILRLAQISSNLRGE